MTERGKSKQVSRDHQEELMNQKEDSEQGSQLQSDNLEVSMGNKKDKNKNTK